MVRIELFSAQHQGTAALVEADASGYRITALLAVLIDSAQALLGLPSGRRLTADDAPEECARGLIARFRSPDLAARIVHDDDPLPSSAEPIVLRQPEQR